MSHRLPTLRQPKIAESEVAQLHTVTQTKAPLEGSDGTNEYSVTHLIHATPGIAAQLLKAFKPRLLAFRCQAALAEPS